LKLADFTVRLRDSDAEHFARVTIEIEMANEKAVEAAQSHMAQLRDSIISLLSDRSVEELEGSAALGRAKKALTERATEILGPKTRRLYVTDLILQ